SVRQLYDDRGIAGETRRRYQCLETARQTRKVTTIHCRGLQGRTTTTFPPDNRGDHSPHARRRSLDRRATAADNGYLREANGPVTKSPTTLRFRCEPAPRSTYMPPVRAGSASRSETCHRSCATKDTVAKKKQDN